MSSNFNQGTSLLIVADDLTGAGDTGVEFCGLGEVAVLNSRDLATVPEGARIISLDTATRNLPEDRARARIAALKPWILKNDPGLVFKKVDSCMRGAPGREIRWLMDTKRSRAIVVPALPTHGRTVENGIIKLNGVPVDQSPMRNDPLSPMTESRPDVILAGQSGKQTRHVMIGEIRKGRDHLRQVLTDLFDRGTDIISLDAVENGDLDIIAGVVLEWMDNTLICASSGLASAIGRVTGKPCENTAPGVPHDLGLYICGSASSVMKTQIQRLKEATDVSELVFGGKGQQFDPLKKTHIFRLPFIDEQKMDAATACETLCRAALPHILQNRYGYIFISGGDTADAFFESVNVKTFHLNGMISPGIPWGYVRQTPLEKTAIITKSGTFGTETTMIEIHDRIERGVHREPR